VIAKHTYVRVNSPESNFHSKTGYITKINNDGSRVPYIVTFDQPSVGWTFSAFAENELEVITLERHEKDLMQKIIDAQDEQIKSLKEVVNLPESIIGTYKTQVLCLERVCAITRLQR
jgi:hypothetical protein